MANFDEFEFYKEIYVQENSRRNDIQNYLNIPLALVSAYITTLYFLLSNYDYKISYFWSSIFLVLGVLFIIITIVSIYYLVMALGYFHGNEYKGLPFPNELKAWKINLDNYYSNIQDSDKQFKEELLKMLIDCGSYNMFVNDTRFKYIYKSKNSLIVGLIALFILTTLFGVNNYQKNIKNLPDTKKINVKGIVNVGTKSISNSSNQNHGRKYSESDSKSDSNSTVNAATSPKRKDYKRGRNTQTTKTNAHEKKIRF